VSQRRFDDPAAVAVQHVMAAAGDVAPDQSLQATCVQGKRRVAINDGARPMLAGAWSLEDVTGALTGFSPMPRPQAAPERQG